MADQFIKGLFPSGTLYPAADLYPEAETQIEPPPVPPTEKISASGPLILCDMNGEEVAELEVVHTIHFEVSRAYSTKFTLGYDQNGAVDLLSMLSAGHVPQVRAYRNKKVLFSGWWAPQQESSKNEASDGITCEFRSPFARLETRYFTSPVPGIADIGQAALDMIRLTNSDNPIGLLTGSFQPTLALDTLAPIGKQVAQAIIDLTELQGGFQFTETMLDPTANSGYLSMINIWNASLHSGFAVDRTETVRFEYGEDTIANVLSVERTTTEPINRVVAIGATLEGQSDPIFVTVDDRGSQAVSGVYATLLQDSAIVDTASLQRKASGMLKPYFVQTVKFEPDIDNNALPIDDYWIGDIVGFYANQDSLHIDTDIAVNVIEIDRDGDGVELAHRLEFGAQTTQLLTPVRRGRQITFRNPSRI